MICNNCKKHNPEGSNFCQYCGENITESNHSQEDISDENTSSTKFISKKTPPYPYVISLWKFFILSTLTFGLFDIYWFYKQWKSFYAVDNEKHGRFHLSIISIFAGFSSFWLFKKILKDVKKVDSNRDLNTTWLSIAYIICNALYRLPGNYWWLSLLSIFALLPVQNTINYYWHEKYGNRLIKSKFGVWNWVWAIVGGIFVILALIGSSGNNSTSNTNSNTNQGQTSLQNQNSSGNASEFTQSVIDIYCDNQEGGSGTIISQSGYVLTNNHVIKGATTCQITLPDTTTGQPKAIYTAKPVVIPNLSQQYDLAFLSITGAYTDDKGKTWGKYPTKFPAVNFSKSCKSYTPKLGDNLKIYGYPVTSGGYNLTVTDGIVSSFDDNNDILTSAKIDSGNSGGLAVSSNGCWVGVPSAVVSGNYQNLGVIIPSSVVGDFANNLENPYQSSNTASSDTNNTNQTFDTTCLTLNNAQMYGNSYYEDNPTYIASLYNGCSQSVKNVVIKVNFYSTGSSVPADTQYVDLGISELDPGDAHALNGTINTPFDTSGQFNWDANVYSAEPY